MNRSLNRKTKLPKPLRASRVPATSGMLYEMEGRLNRRMDAGFHKVDARFHKVDARFHKVDLRFNKIDARFDVVDERFKKVDARFDKVEAEISGLRTEMKSEVGGLRSEMKAGFDEIKSLIENLSAEIHRQGLLVEQQAAENRYVLESHTVLDSHMRKLLGENPEDV